MAKRMTKEDAYHAAHRLGVPVEEVDRQLGTANPYDDKLGMSKRDQTIYKNVRTYSEIIGRWFDSGWECTVGERLWFRQKAGEISDLNFQVRVDLLTGQDDRRKRWWITMYPDFQYIEDGELVTYEAKGKETKKYTLQRRLWQVLGPTKYIVDYMSKGKPNGIIIPRPNAGMMRLALKWLIRDHGGDITLTEAADMLAEAGE